MSRSVFPFEPFRPSEMSAAMLRWEADGIYVSGPLGHKVIRCKPCGSSNHKWVVPSIEDAFVSVEQHRDSRTHRDLVAGVKALGLNP